ncbi:acyl-CoA dehydrogenase family protein [Halotalea alkalilenta]|uniref:Acyl-CoA dehydrogenase n=1 Tax=Halotalea alkalilenta TaxID=376489 RepID=A0A172YDE1_9GAMM|nr:acyl-CoA dehydrogenase family protein [Halotalea alkalilenta]ANF57005.1 hypothetical protein A5892_05590 [Halotalea alkalilenta]
MSERGSDEVGYRIERDAEEQARIEFQALETARSLAAEFSARLSEREARDRLPFEAIERLKHSGLSTAGIAISRGGLGLGWPALCRVVREVAAGDGSVGAVLGYHLMQTFHLRREPTPRWHALERRIAEQRLWLAGVVNPRDDDVLARTHGDGFVLDGRKHFCTGSGFADLLTFSVKHRDTQQAGFALLPVDREGITLGGDWDAIGLERSESGSVGLEGVYAGADELVFERDDPRGRFVTTIRGPVNQSLFTNFYIGFAVGALRAAKRFIHHSSRPWLHSDAPTASEDVLIRTQFGELWVMLESMIALADRAAERMAELLAAGEAYTPEQRGEAAAAVAIAKAHATRGGLDICTRVFELMGARATHNRYGFDRFWRDIRTHTLHDPVAYKLLEIGDYALNDRYAEGSAYR